MEITTFSYSYGKNRHNLSFEWDHEALTRGVIAFPITAWITSSDGREPIGEPLSATVGVEKEMLFVEMKEQRFEIRLEELLHEDTVVGQAIEKVHASFIGVDPAIGCLIRAGTIMSTYKVVLEGTYDGKDSSGTYNAGSVWKMGKGGRQGIFHTNVKEEKPASQ